MPQVPTYDNFTVKPTVNPDVRVTAPEIQDFSAKQALQSGQALMNAGGAMARIGADIQNEANAVRVDDATNQITEAALALRYDRTTGYESVTGEAALNRESGKPLAVEYQEKLQQKIDEVGAKLGNDQQRKLFGLKARNISMQLYAQATVHENKQFQDYTLSVQEGTIKNASNAIVLNPLDTANVEQNLAEINRAVYTTGKLKGMSGPQIEAVQREATSATHLNVVKALLTPDDSGNVNTDGATAYFKQFKDQFSGVQRAEAAKLVGAADQAKVAITSADQIWAEIGPKGYNDPVDLYKMEVKAREMFPNDPAKSKATIEEIRSRKQAFDASQSEFVADNVNQVGKMVLAGRGLAAIQASPAFQALPGDKQEQIATHVITRANTLTAQAEAANARKNFAQYLEYTDPNKLVTMSRKEVEALWPTLGREHTATLVSRWDSLQNKDALLTSRMDAEQFNAIAQQFDLKPYEKNKSENEKATLGLIHNNVNAVLEQEAKAARRPLTREEKDTIMRREMAKTVTVAGSWWGTSEVRLPAMTDEQAARVVVPQAQRPTLADEMAKLYAVNKNPRYAPTEVNLQRYYLLKRSADRTTGNTQ